MSMVENETTTNTVTRQEQIQNGLVKAPKNFVHANPHRNVPAMPVNAEVVHTIDAPLSATQHIDMRTSAVDRAKGFLIASLPLYAAFSFLVLLIAVVGFGIPLFSIPALLIAWLSFVAAWIVGYGYTLTVSAEGVSLFEAKSKWGIIKEEQRRRWEHFERMVEGGNE
jgi:hypothetical protein